LLLDLVPELLVEPGALPRPRRAAAGESLDQGLARRGEGRAARRPRGSVPALSLPSDHELRQGLPKGPQPGQGDRRNQADADRAAGVTLRALGPGFDPAVVATIDAKLAGIEREQVELLIAVESGSRAWGFPSP